MLPSFPAAVLSRTNRVKQTHTCFLLLFTIIVLHPRNALVSIDVECRGEMKHTHTWLFFKRSSSYFKIKYRGTTRSPKHPSPAHQPHIALLMQCMYAPSSSLLLSHEFTSAMQCFSLAATVTPGDASNASTFVGCP